jgi:chaperonin GroES
MARKDMLAAGARSARFVGGVGEGVDLKKVSTEPRMKFKAEKAKPEPKKEFRPKGDVLLIRRSEVKVSPLLQGVESVKVDQPAEGTILAAGPKVVDTKAGEVVVYGKYAGAEFSLNGETLLLMREDEILGTIE